MPEERNSLDIESPRYPPSKTPPIESILDAATSSEYVSKSLAPVERKWTRRQADSLRDSQSNPKCLVLGQNRVSFQFPSEEKKKLTIICAG